MMFGENTVEKPNRPGAAAFDAPATIAVKATTLIKPVITLEYFILKTRFLVRVS